MTHNIHQCGLCGFSKPIYVDDIDQAGELRGYYNGNTPGEKYWKKSSARQQIGTGNTQDMGVSAGVGGASRAPSSTWIAQGQAAGPSSSAYSQKQPNHNLYSQPPSASHTAQSNLCDRCKSNIDFEGSQGGNNGLAKSEVIGEGNTSIPPHQMTTANPHGSTYLSKAYKPAVVVSEYTDSFYSPYKPKLFETRPGFGELGYSSKLKPSYIESEVGYGNQGGVASQPLSSQFHSDALNHSQGTRGGYLKGQKEKTLYPVNDMTTVTHRYHPAVYENYQQIPENVKHSDRFYISQNWNKKYHVYDIGEKEIKENTSGLEFEREAVPYSRR